MKKILIIRFSAMGDVVLTSPVIRCLKDQVPGCSIHYLIKSKFSEAVASHPFVDKLHLINEHPNEILSQLMNEKFDVVIDLQRNRKSVGLCRKLKTTYYTFPKLNLQKFLLTTLKINRLPKTHVVDRYFEAVKLLGVKNDNKGLDYFLNPADNLFTAEESVWMQKKYIALVLGATYYTKRIPIQKLKEIISSLHSPVVLLGGPAENEIATELHKEFPYLLNTVGKCSLQQSAHYIKNAAAVITSDTGLMHIAAAFNKKIITIWGNTVPDFGMYAYIPQKPENVINFEVKDLSCRPCSKLGHHHCPKKHFNCMMKQNAEQIALTVEQSL